MQGLVIGLQADVSPQLRQECLYQFGRLFLSQLSLQLVARSGKTHGPGVHDLIDPELAIGQANRFRVIADRKRVYVFLQVHRDALGGQVAVQFPTLRCRRFVLRSAVCQFGEIPAVGKALPDLLSFCLRIDDDQAQLDLALLVRGLVSRSQLLLIDVDLGEEFSLEQQAQHPFDFFPL